MFFLRFSSFLGPTSIRYNQVHCFLILLSSFLFPLPSFLFLLPLSSFLFPLSSFLFPLSSFLVPLSSFLLSSFPLFLFPHSSFLFPLSSFLFHASCFFFSSQEHGELELRSDLLDCNVDVCSPEVLVQLSDNFDYQVSKQPLSSRSTLFVPVCLQ